MTLFEDYSSRLQSTLAATDWGNVEQLATALQNCWEEGRQLFICGNGGSAGNAVHLANDFLYGTSKIYGSGIKAHALSANTSVITCLGNDVGYDAIYSHQLAVLANPGDLLLVMSGSGNSPNILNALETAQEKNLQSFAILGYTGGKAKAKADVAIHFDINDMQISEDLQIIVGHMVMQWLYEHNKS